MALIAPRARTTIGVVDPATAMVSRQIAKEIASRLVAIEQEQLRVLRCIDAKLDDLAWAPYREGVQHVIAGSHPAIGIDRATQEFEAARSCFIAAHAKLGQNPLGRSVVASAAARAALLAGWPVDEAQRWLGIAHENAVDALRQRCDELTAQVAKKRLGRPGFAFTRAQNRIEEGPVLGPVSFVLGGMFTGEVALALEARGNKLVAAEVPKLTEMDAYVARLAAERVRAGTPSAEVAVFELAVTQTPWQVAYKKTSKTVATIVTRTPETPAWKLTEVVARFRHSALPVRLQRARRTFANDSDMIIAAAFSPDARRLATGGGDRTARIWDIDTTQELCKLVHSAKVRVLQFDSTGDYLGTVCDDGSIRVWDVRAAEIVTRPIQHPNARQLVFNADGSRIATSTEWSSASATRTQVWDTATGDSIFGSERHGPMAFSADGQQIVIGDTVSDIASAEAVARLDFVEPDATVLAFTPALTRAATATKSGTTVWDVATGLPVHQSGSHPVKVMFSHDGVLMATENSSRNDASVWEIATGREVARISHSTWLTAMAFSAEGLAVATVDYDERVARVSRSVALL